MQRFHFYLQQQSNFPFSPSVKLIERILSSGLDAAARWMCKRIRFQSVPWTGGYFRVTELYLAYHGRSLSAVEWPRRLLLVMDNKNQIIEMVKCTKNRVERGWKRRQ